MKFKINSKVKVFTIILGSIAATFYLLFLLLPFILSPVANKYCSQIKNLIETSTGFKADIDGIRVLTTPKLSAGVGVKNFVLFDPISNEKILDLKNSEVKLALIPLLWRNIELDKIGVESVSGKLVVNKDGNFEILDYLPKNDDENQPAMISLPYPFKLSNRLPDIYANEYLLSFIDGSTKNEYGINGKDLKITNFILNKSIKLSSTGEVKLRDFVMSKYNLKISNKIMPDLNLDDIVFPKAVEEDEVKPQDTNINVIEIFDAIYKNKLKADVSADIQVSGTRKHPIQKGILSINSMTLNVNGKPLPESYLNLSFKGYRSEIDSVLYSSDDKTEKTVITGNIKNGKKRSVDVSFKSNAKFNNLIRMIDSIAQTFGINDFKTLSATGSIDADFTLNSDMKTINSKGYVKVAPSRLTYGLYNTTLENINADIDLSDNTVNIKNAGFSILGQPLKIGGKIQSDSSAYIKIYSNKLALKGVLLALGQKALLNENDVQQGNISLNVLLKGKLLEIIPDVNVKLGDLNIFNKPSGARLLLNNAIVKFAIKNENDISGTVDINNLGVKYSSAMLSVPAALVEINAKDIKIKDSYVLVNNSKVNFGGLVKDYPTNKMNMSIKAHGNVKASDIMSFIPVEMRSMFKGAGSMPVEITAAGDSKTQDICFKLSATPNGYVQFADVNLLRGKNTNIHTDIKLNGESLTLSDSYIAANSTKIATFTGGVEKLYSNPRMNINISVPNDVSFPIWGMGTSNVTANGSIIVNGSFEDPKLKGTVNISDISIKDMDFKLTNTIAHLNGSFLNGSATAQKVKFGTITAENISTKISLKNFNEFYMNDISAQAYKGKVNGSISYNISSTGIGVNMTGKGLDSTEVVYATTGIKNALTGSMAFDAKISTRGITDKDIIHNMIGPVNFTIDEGRFMGIGRLENLVAAQNVTSNTLLKVAIGALSIASAMQEADSYKKIDGSMTLKGGAANISKINVIGPAMSYHVKGSYNIMPNTANLVILGRLDAKVVSALGVVGKLSAEKIISAIPGLGDKTKTVLNSMLADPKKEDTSVIPALSSGRNQYKDFKVIYYGTAGSASAVRSFRWLSTCDTTEMNVVKDIKDAKEAVKTNIETSIKDTRKTVENVQNNINTIVETKKQQVREVKKSINQAKQDIQNLKNLFKAPKVNTNSTQSAPVAQTSTPQNAVVQPETAPAAAGETPAQ